VCPLTQPLGITERKLHGEFLEVCLMALKLAGHRPALPSDFVQSCSGRLAGSADLLRLLLRYIRKDNMPPFDLASLPCGEPGAHGMARHGN
jgi:hypothetical protein